MPKPPKPAPAPRDPDSSRVFAILLQRGQQPQDAYAFVQEVQNMVSENLIARFEAKLDALAAAQSAEVARLASKLDALAAAQAAQLEAVRTELQEQIKSVRWVLGGLAVALTLIFAAGQFGFAYRQATGSPQAAPATEQSPAAGTSPSGPP